MLIYVNALAKRHNVLTIISGYIILINMSMIRITTIAMPIETSHFNAFAKNLQGEMAESKEGEGV